MVLLVEILHAHAILLRDGVHAFSRLNHVWTSLVLLRRLLAFLLQVDDVALLQHVVLVALVVSSQFSPADAHFLAQCLEGISLAGIEIVVVVEQVDRVEQPLTVDRLVGAAVACHEAVVALCLVVVEELVELDNLYQLVGILRIGGIAAGLQSSRPTLVVGLRELEQSGIAWLSCKKLAMVFVAVSCVTVYSEAFAPGIVVMILCRTGPVVAFDAEVVVALPHEVAPSGSTLKESLCKGDAGRNAVT